MKPGNYTIGIDEVGRGPIAGPVAVGAFVFLKKENSAEIRKIFRGVRESKQLSEARREEWFMIVENAAAKGLVDYSVMFVSERIIDKKGIAPAIRSALAGALGELVTRHNLRPESVCVLLDGGLRAPAEFTHQKTIIKGDAKEQAIALASICAKVLRDRKMHKLARKYPNYGLEIHKGYGTKAHYEAIHRRGLTPLHRRSFLTKILAKKPQLL